MIRVCLALFFLLSPGLAAAEEVPVKSGEHADFSRIVFLFGTTPEWRLGRFAAGYELRLDTQQAEYDFSTVFEFIPRTRLQALSANGDSSIRFGVSCDCHADAFEIPVGLVVDIKDGPPPTGSNFETLFDAPGPERPGAQPPTGSAMPKFKALGPIPGFTFKPVRTEFAWHDRIALDLRGVSDREITALPNQEVADSGSAPPDKRPTKPDPVRVAQAALLAQISRGAAQGLLSIDSPQLPSAGGKRAAVDVAVEDPTDPDIPDPTHTLTLNQTEPGIRVQTALDQRPGSAAAGTQMTPDGQACIRSDLLDLSVWRQSLTDGPNFGSLHAKITGEFGEPQPRAIEALVKAQLYWTFGAEATVLLDSFDVEIPEANLYRTIADIMDDGTAIDPGPLRDQLQCDSRAALWAALAQPLPRSAGNVAQEAILAAFAELPLHLRRHLGPELAQRFLQSGNGDTAAAIRNRIAQAPGDHGPGFTMMQAEIDLAAGDASAAEQQLSQVVDAGADNLPEALVRLIDTQLDTGSTVTIGDLQAAMALAQEYRGTDLGAALFRVSMRAAIHAGRFGDTLERLAAEADDAGLNAEDITALRRELFRIATQSASDAVFLQIVLAGPMQLGSDEMDDAIRRDAADRLLSLHLPESARAVLSETVGVPSKADRILFAKAHLEDRRPDLAIGYLAGLRSEVALRLLARAHEALGEYDRAATVYSDLEDSAMVAASHWRGRQWAAATGLEPAVRQAAANLTETPLDAGLDQPNAADRPLARNRALISHSRQTRAILVGLLAETEQP